MAGAGSLPPEGMAGELPSSDLQIIPPRPGSVNPETLQGIQDDLRLARDILVFPGEAEGYIQITQIMENRATAGQPADQHTAVPG